jgi:hypothetical protein
LESPDEPAEEPVPDESDELDELDEPAPEGDEPLPAVDEPFPDWVTAAWLDPGRIAATAPAAITLAAVRVTVVAFSRRRPCSRSATAWAT